MAFEAQGDEPGEVELKAEPRPEGIIEITVRDNGPGIPTDMLGRVFDPFVTSKPQGMGMGLSISRSIVEAHGGRLWIDSTCSTGTTLRFTLPAKDRAAPA